MIAGLEDVTMGDIYVGDLDVAYDKPPQQRDIAMVFQNYALYPHDGAGQPRLRAQAPEDAQG